MVLQLSMRRDKRALKILVLFEQVKIVDDTFFELTMIFGDQNRASQRKQLGSVQMDVWMSGSCKKSMKTQEV